MVGDCRTAALVGRDGSIDWLCVPQFDGGACFAALLGAPENGRWLLAPTHATTSVKRRYRDDTLVLETDFETQSGLVRVIDFMPLTDDRLELVRIVAGLRGSVEMALEIVIRFDYGSIVPWVRHGNGRLVATAGPDTLELTGPVEVHGENMKSRATFDVRAGSRHEFVLSYRPSHTASRPPLDASRALQDTGQAWRKWSGQSKFDGHYRAAVQRSLITLKALTLAETGGIAAAPTTSLPERQGGVRNWDYRYCWLRDATFTLNALLLAGYRDEAVAWREWLLRAVAGSPQDLQIMYGLAGQRRLEETELPWLPGYKGAAPVRVGNAASRQFQLDVYGEVMDTLHLARRSGLEPDATAWSIQVELLRYLEKHWQDPDEGIWEIRGERRHFTHSRVMTWVAVDRGIKAVERFSLNGPVDRWRDLRSRIHREVCERGVRSDTNSFVQAYGSKELDASLLMIPLVGFLPADDP
ncbi:MAG: glycoside hydrolase family 15 protein, partial [Pseudomonadales bacterium]|nr:glycoside hydrolase family 15 protein [Pseudomonadales bacterium]